VNIRFQLYDLRIGDEDHAIDPSEYQFSRVVVKLLSGNCIEVELGFKTIDFYQVEWHEIEEKGSFIPGRHRDQLSPVGRGDLRIYVFEIGGFAAETGAVIDDLAVYFLQGEIDYGHVAVPVQD
jgi:hypothetical protein